MVVSFFLPLLFTLCGVLAVAFGVVALWQIRRSARRQKGVGMAMAGIILGLSGSGAVLFFLWALSHMNLH